MNGDEQHSANREMRLVQAFVTMADTLVDDYDVAEVLHRLVSYCVELMDATAAGLMLSDQHGALHALAASTERARLLELFQLQTNEGPCLDCFRSSEAVLAPDLSQRSRQWPQFAPKAMEAGFRSVHAIPMRLRQDTIGALNLFHSTPGSLSTHDVQLAQAMADIATIGILHERAIHRSEVVTEQLQTALNNRIVIEQAKGVLAQAGGVEMHEAFTVLRDYSRSNSVRLSDIAHQLAAGSIDPEALFSWKPVR